MRFGVSFASQPSMVDVAVGAERLGYDWVGFYDTPLVCSDPFVVAGLVAAQSEEIEIAIAVAIPYLRLPHALATAAGTLNQIAPGRIALGFGTGYTGAQTTGSKPDTWATVREHVRVCRALLDGEEVEIEVKGNRRLVKHLHPDKEFVNLSDRVPIFISALGPKGRQVTAEVADGLVTICGGNRANAAAVEPAVRDFEADLERTGRQGLPVTLLTAMAVRGPDEPGDSPRLRSFMGPWVTSHLHGDLGGSAGNPDTPEPIQRATARYAEMAASHREDAPWIENHRGHSTFVRPEEEELLDAETLAAMCQIGTAEELIEEIRGLEAIGVDRVAWQCIPGHEDEVERFAREVIEPYRASSASASSSVTA
jgi:5,10-methylenetetrahydromethanopterin reductase